MSIHKDDLDSVNKFNKMMGGPEGRVNPDREAKSGQLRYGQIPPTDKK
jgi:hypothetical protein